MLHVLLHVDSIQNIHINKHVHACMHTYIHTYRVRYSASRLLGSLILHHAIHAQSVEPSMTNAVLSCTHHAVASLFSSIRSTGGMRVTLEHWSGFVLPAGGKAYEVVRTLLCISCL